MAIPGDTKSIDPNRALTRCFASTKKSYIESVDVIRALDLWRRVKVHARRCAVIRYMRAITDFQLP